MGQAGNQQLSSPWIDCNHPCSAYKIEKIPSGYTDVLLGVLACLEQFSCCLRYLHHYCNQVIGCLAKPED